MIYCIQFLMIKSLHRKVCVFEKASMYGIKQSH